VTGSYDTAHDAVQEGFARALKARKTFRGGSLEAVVFTARVVWPIRGSTFATRMGRVPASLRDTTA
jgi:hypothetical protein